MATADIIKTQKTELFWASAATTATRAVGVDSISGLGSGAKDQIETTTLDNAADKTFVAGLGNPGAVQIAFKIRADDPSHSALVALKDAGTVVSWGVYSSHAATAPTAVGSVMQTVLARASVIFNAYVSDVSIEVGVNNVWNGTLTLQTSGTPSYKLTTA